jgi:hypothetical protein
MHEKPKCRARLQRQVRLLISSSDSLRFPASAIPAKTFLMLSLHIHIEPRREAFAVSPFRAMAQGVRRRFISSLVSVRGLTTELTGSPSRTDRSK